jgi:hypothetical protein
MFRRSAPAKQLSRKPTGRLQRLRIEHLEDRRLLAISSLEQEFIYLLNRARHDPAAYAEEVDLGVDLTGVPARPPLAVNAHLLDSTQFHVDEMVAHNYFAHTSAVTGDQPNKMARDAGYPLPGWWSSDANYIESLGHGRVAANALHGLLRDEPHRIHILGTPTFWAENREIGVGHALSKNYWAIHTAHESANDRFLTGVVFDDLNSNQRYDAGEGLADVTVTAGESSTATNAAGGWAMKVADGDYQVVASGGAFRGTAAVPVTVAGKSVAVDFLSGLRGGYVNFEPWMSSDPTVRSVVRADANPTDQSSVRFTVTFNEAVVNVDPSDFRVIATGSAKGQVAAVSGDGDSYTVAVDSIFGAGALALAFDEGQDIEDTSGNGLYLGDFPGSEVYDVDRLKLTLSLTLNQSSEAALIPAAWGTVTREGDDLSRPLVVAVSSSDPSEASVFPTVTIPAGEASAGILIQAVDDELLDGAQTVDLVVAAEGYRSAQQSIVISDYETITVTLDAESVAEDAGPGAVIGYVERSNTDADQPLTVQLTSSAPGEATVPPTVVIPPGVRSVAFALDPVGDGVRDGRQTVTIRASAAGYESIDARLDVTDRDVLTVVNDTARTQPGRSVTITVLANDHSRGAVLLPASITVRIAPAAGEAVVDPGTGRITYTPHDGFAGNDNFEYSVSDDHGATAVGRVTIGVADGPLWQNPDLQTDVDGDGRVQLDDLLMLVQILREQGSPYLLPQERTSDEETMHPDVNGDGQASLTDLVEVLQQLRAEFNAS